MSLWPCTTPGGLCSWPVRAGASQGPWLQPGLLQAARIETWPAWVEVSWANRDLTPAYGWVEDRERDSQVVKSAPQIECLEVLVRTFLYVRWRCNLKGGRRACRRPLESSQVSRGNVLTNRFRKFGLNAPCLILKIRLSGYSRGLNSDHKRF